MTVISSGKLPVTATARDCFEQLAFSSVLKKLFLSRRVVDNAGVLPAAAVQGCGQCSITGTAHVLPLQLQWGFTLAAVISSKGEPHRGQGHPECQTLATELCQERRDTPKQEGMQNNSLWNLRIHRMPGRSRSFISSIFVVTTTPQTKMYTEFLAGWSQQSTCILYRKEF